VPTRRRSATPKQTLTPLSFATSDSETDDIPTPNDTDDDLFRSAAMIGVYVAAGILVLTTLAICVFLRRTMTDPLAGEIETHLVDDPSLQTEGTIMI
jgi:hypothetical protein